jgi:putative ABC transport system permease protein
MALAVILLFGAGLMLRTFAELYAVDPGFETRQITRFTIGLPSTDYSDLESIRTFYRRLEERLASRPGVEDVGSVYGAPLGYGRAAGTVLVEGRPEPQPWEETGAAIRGVSPQYLQTLRIPLIRGRYLERADDSDGLPVAVVNEAFVRENFPGGDPIGERVRITVNMGYGSPTWTIVGVVGDVRTRSIMREAEAEIYVPHGRFGPAFMTVSVRSAPGTAGLAGRIRSEVRALDPSLPLQNVETVSEAVRGQLAPTRFLLVMVGLFAALAVTLAAVGLYGVMAYLFSRRLREIGVRVALGARPAEVVLLVMAGGLGPATAGLVAGMPAAQAGGRLVESVLYGVTPRDPWLLVAVPLFLIVVAATAVAIPATRAGLVDPVAVLRAE